MNWEEKYRAVSELVEGYRRERDEWRDKFLALNQTAGELCNACGWAFRIPGEPCRCEVVKERDEARADAQRWRESREERNDEANNIQRALNRAARERDEARAEVARLNALLSSVTAENQYRAQREACALQDWQALRAECDEVRAEVERLRAEADRWKRSCNVFRERDWPKAFQATVTSLEQEVSDAHEQLAKLRKLSKPWEGGAYRRGAEAMREACAREVVEGRLGVSPDDVAWLNDIASDVRALPIPEEP